MSLSTSPSISFSQSALALPLTPRGPRLPSISGDPVESVQELYNDGATRTGVWECTPGRFESSRRGDTEAMHFVAGEATITSADGTAHEMTAGSVFIAPDGWSGTWEIHATVRKVYTIWKSIPVTAG